MDETEHRLVTVRPHARPSQSARENALHTALAALDDVGPVAGGGKRRSWAIRGALAGVLVAVVVAAPAVALQSSLISWGESESADERTQLRFSELFAEGAPPRMDPHVVPFSARKVTVFHLASGSYTLWAAPTADGGYCREFEGLGGGCVTERVPATSGAAPNDYRPWFIHVTSRGSDAQSVANLVGGDILAPSAAKLELIYRDGESESVPFVWVSAPIDAGFYLFDVPPNRRTLARGPAELVVRNADGDVLASTRSQFEYSP